MSAKNTAKQTQPAPAGDSFIEKHADALAICIMVLTAIMALLLFNVRMNEGGDDSTYICKAADFLESGKYPNFQGPLYPIFLSLFIWLSGGIKLIVLKATSYVLILAGQALMWFSLRRVVSRALLLGVMLLMALNLWFVQYGSLTYSEPLFLVVVWGFVFTLLRLDALADEDGWKKIALWAGVAAFVVVLAFLVRTVGLGLGLAGIVFLLARRAWRKALALVGGIAVFLLIWTGVKAVAWPNLKADTHQLQTLLQVDPYDAANGLETPKGYVKRFIGNSDLYLSKHYVKMLGFRDVSSRETNRAASVVLYALFLWGAYAAFSKQERGVMLVATVTAVMLGATFFSLQVLWDQYRLILPFVGMMHIVILYSLADLVRRLAGDKTRVVMGIAVGICSLLLFSKEAKTVDFKTLRKNLTTDPLYGYTPDWYNYLSLCQEIGKRMPEETVYVAARKPDMARIYSGGKRFYGIYNIPSDDPDVLVETLRKNGVTHMIVGSLRRDPAQAGLGVINTIHRYLHRILQKYPRFVELYAQSGRDDDEPAQLVTLNYEMATAEYASPTYQPETEE